MSKNSVKTILITLYLSAVQDPEPLSIFNGNFQIFRPPVRGVKRSFWQKPKFSPGFEYITAPKNVR